MPFRLASCLALTLALSLPTLPAFAAGNVITVSTADALETAVANAQPGDTIVMADGEYRAEVFATVSGTAAAPITLTGSRNAIIINDFLRAANNTLPVWPHRLWRVAQRRKLLAPNRLHIAYSKKGIVVDNATETSSSTPPAASPTSPNAVKPRLRG